MPIAMVVQIVIENQFQRLINGFALGPPIRTLANPDLQNTVQQIARQSMTEKKAQTLKSHPNWSRTHVFAMVTVVENFPGTSSPSCIWSGLQKFKTMAESNNKNGGQKTKWFNPAPTAFSFDSWREAWGGDELDTILASFKNNIHQCLQREV